MTSTVVASWRKNTVRAHLRSENRKGRRRGGNVCGVGKQSKLRAGGAMRSVVIHGVAVTEMYHGEAGSILPLAGYGRFSLWQAS